ncbi:disease resistance protein RPV1-like [Vicia villosa]|uniref:disease resistance protein RPV1-like n=1 Tax=Vicia villosa TaxID=3911 RepID=UPI00273CB5AE|nr:disease resistance protein RPV1-like [Vicia villosa]XP_058779824.1 disease resistance protein RPV1-like [Vicia villosa]XP_058779825.1 disease resistance protein RPV1-like [Vicia villosa]
MQGAEASNSSMDYSNNQTCRYDVFISFRGPDTRNNFVDHLYDHLTRKGIFAFKDDRRLEKGDSLSPQLLQAIQNSRISIVVFSKTYADSTWCLEEMATIAECRKEFNQKVFPIFYDVDPSHVRHRRGLYQNAFDLYRMRFKHDQRKVGRWKKAMDVLANLVGWDIRNKPESIEIKKIVQAIIKTLNHKFSGFTNDLVGMQPRIEELEKLLRLSSMDDDFRVLGIWGMGGVGKTTHAAALYDRISYQFDACCFINNTSKLYMDGGVVAVQKQILRQALDERNLDAYDTCEITGIMINRLQSGIKVLLVLDNVDQYEQLEELAIDPKLLYKESRIIITTRDEHILRVYGVDKIHEVPLLNSNDASELFRRRAFKGEDQSSNCVELIPEILKYVQNLPLAIKVVGSFLCNRDATQWRDALDRLKNNPDNKIMDVLQMSVDGLEHEEKEIFLHIACFFKGEREDYVKRILDACGLYPHIGIQRVIEKSLITIKNQEIHMHDMLQELGKKIVRHSFLEDPILWSRIWQYHDFYQVLTSETGTNNVKAIVLDQKESFSKCRAEGFSNMSNLALLILYHNNFSGNLDFLSNNLRYLLWNGCPFTSLPSNFEPHYLVELNIPDSSIQRLWEGRKELPNLKRMDLSNSKYLIETPKFFWTPKLERLDFTGCTNLIQVHPSIGHLTELVFLCLQNCSSLVDLDFGSVSRLNSLRVLRLSGCTKLEKTPDFTGASNLEYLDMDECTTLSKVHESIGALTKLKFLSLRNCTNLVEMPDRIKRMASLVTLDFCGCSSLTILPLKRTRTDHMRSLIFLDLSFCNLHEVPNTIGTLRTLERLNLQGNKFRSLPDDFFDLDNLAYVNLSHCHELESIELQFSQSTSQSASKSASSGGRYFNMVAGSRDHRSGFYIFDCPNFIVKSKDKSIECSWLQRLLQSPHHFRGGFDIVVPWNRENIDSPSSCCIPKWFNYQFDSDSIVRIVDFDEFDMKFGFAFCVEFEVNNSPASSGLPQDSFSSALPHPFYLSFESEHTEERFDMPLSLELHKVDGSKHLWLIYISQEHCHFLKTGAHITFKAGPGLSIKKWGLRLAIKDLRKSYRVPSDWEHSSDSYAPQLFLDYVQKTSMKSGTKIQLPYNWFVTEEEEVENSGAKSKETALSNLGL